MPVDAILQAQPTGPVAALAASDGCAAHPLVQRLGAPGATVRDLADAVHALCAVHGRASDFFEEAARRAAPPVRDALEQAAVAFGRERAYLARLTAAVGPLPSTPGQRESDAAFAAQRHAFDLLVRSDRAGCATGAALALLLDWLAFRRVLDAAARRVGTAVAPPVMPVVADTPFPQTMQRAVAFGAQQVFAQHRGLCDLIEARAAARDQADARHS